MPCEIHVGTCGFSYPEWVEAGIYPPGTKQGHTLPIYNHVNGQAVKNAKMLMSMMNYK